MSARLDTMMSDLATGKLYSLVDAAGNAIGFNTTAFGLREVNPAPFAAYLEFDGVTVASASPERFLRVDTAGHVETRPIKGTTPRGLSPQHDAALSRALRDSEKDRAENLMIVDLLRNDLSRVCRPGSVRATGPRSPSGPRSSPARALHACPPCAHAWPPRARPCSRRATRPTMTMPWSRR